MYAHTKVELRCEIPILAATELINKILDYAVMVFCAGGYVKSDNRVE